ncbi:MAG: hypothetical protein WEE66_08595 [Actinomycetota bacterium]
MNKHRFARMLTPMRGAAFLAALLVVGFATVAQGYNGDPLIIGTWNTSGLAEGGTDNGATSWNVSAGGLLIHSDGGPTPLELIAADGNDNPALKIYAQNIAISAQGRVILDGSVNVQGRVILDGSSGVAIVPAGANRVTISVGIIGPSTLVLATVQQTAGGAMVKAAVPNRTQGTFTIYLNKNASVKTSVAWTVIN